MNKLNIKSLALSFGITWGAGLLLLGWCAIFNWGTDIVEVLSSFYVGYSPTFLGGIIGGIWGFFDAAIAGLLIAFFYNLFSKKPKISKNTKKKGK